MNVFEFMYTFLSLLILKKRIDCLNSWDMLIMLPEGEHIVAALSDRLSVHPSARHTFFRRISVKVLKVI